MSLSGTLLEVPACLFAHSDSTQSAFMIGISGLRRRRVGPVRAQSGSVEEGRRGVPKMAEASALVETLEVAAARRLLGLTLDAALAAFALHALQRHMAHSMWIL